MLRMFCSTLVFKPFLKGIRSATDKHTYAILPMLPARTGHRKKWTPASRAIRRASLNARLLTPAERNRNGLVVTAAAFRKRSRASLRECVTNVPDEAEEPST